jgi:hypothetical protein
MSEQPTCITARNRKARKEHKCCECRKVIVKGEMYSFTSGIWDGEPNAFKQCINCAEILEAVGSVVGQYDESPCFEELASWFLEKAYDGYTGEDLITDMADFIDIEREKLATLLQPIFEKEESEI